MTAETRPYAPAAGAVQEKGGAQDTEQERQFREILEYCPAALIVVDEEGRLIFHNASLRELLGHEKDEIELSTRGDSGSTSTTAHVSSRRSTSGAASF
jgi:PAS domain-containing protein